MRPWDDLRAGVGLSRGDRPRSRITRTRDAALAAYSLYQLGNALAQQVQERFSRPGYTVSVEEDDELFQTVQRWVAARVPGAQVRDLDAWLDQDAQDRRRWNLALTNTTRTPQEVRVGGVRVSVAYEEPDTTTTTRRGQQEVQTRSKARFVFTCRTPQGKDRVVALLRELTEEYNRETRPPARVFVSSAWGSWEKLQGVGRSLDSVVLRAGLREELVEDLTRFLGQERRYADLGLPWHRGYLLSGPPGTGKSSLVKAVCGHLGLDLYYAQLPDLLADADLTKMLQQVEPRSCLLLEDVDALETLNVRETEKSGTPRGVTMSGILNNLDGVVTPHGLIVFMSTNHRERLDPAVLRRGRVDLELELDLLDSDQLRRLAVQMLGEEPPDLPDGVGQLRISPAEIVEVVKQHLDKPDPTDALGEIRALVRRRQTDAAS